MLIAGNCSHVDVILDCQSNEYNICNSVGQLAHTTQNKFAAIRAAVHVAKQSKPKRRIDTLADLIAEIAAIGEYD